MKKAGTGESLFQCCFVFHKFHSKLQDEVWLTFCWEQSPLTRRRILEQTARVPRDRICWRSKVWKLNCCSLLRHSVQRNRLMAQSIKPVLPTDILNQGHYQIGMSYTPGKIHWIISTNSNPTVHKKAARKVRRQQWHTLPSPKRPNGLRPTKPPVQCSFPRVKGQKREVDHSPPFPISLHGVVLNSFSTGAILLLSYASKNHLRRTG